MKQAKAAAAGINHHNTLRLVSRNSVAFMYANGLLLVGVVCIPFTTSVLGAFLLTDAAPPAVALYDAVLAFQAAGWVAVTAAALRDELAREGTAVAELARRRNSGYGAAGLYALLTVLALRLPEAVALVTAITWVVWLALSLRAPQSTVAAA